MIMVPDIILILLYHKNDYHNTSFNSDNNDNNDVKPFF